MTLRLTRLTREQRLGFVVLVCALLAIKVAITVISASSVSVGLACGVQS